MHFLNFTMKFKFFVRSLVLPIAPIYSVRTGRKTVHNWGDAMSESNVLPFPSLPPAARCDENDLCDDPECVSCRMLRWLQRGADDE